MVSLEVVIAYVFAGPVFPKRVIEGVIRIFVAYIVVRKYFLTEIW